jgi:hypothetical protein
MVSLSSLWLPILLAAVVVFLASSIAHMLLPWHRKDFRGAPNEEALRTALRSIDLPPGDYMVPHGGGPEAMKSPEFQKKMQEGPVVLMTVLPPGPGDMGTSLIQWFVYCVVVSVFAAYLASRAVAPGGDYLQVFRFAGTAAFLGYSLALWQGSIWFKRSWGTTFRSTVDGLAYALITAGIFGWLWPPR